MLPSLLSVLSDQASQSVHLRQYNPGASQEFLQSQSAVSVRPTDDSEPSFCASTSALVQVPASHVPRLYPTPFPDSPGRMQPLPPHLPPPSGCPDSGTPCRRAGESRTAYPHPWFPSHLRLPCLPTVEGLHLTASRTSSCRNHFCQAAQ